STHLQKLKDASKARIAVDDGFKLIADDIKTYKEKELDRSRISLKEPSEKEKKEEKAREEKRKAQGAKKKGSEDKDDDDAEVHLVDDYHLQETLKVATDFMALSAGKPLVALSIPEVSKAKAERLAQEKSKEKKGQSAKAKKPN
ncbi:MAG: carboxy terminal-processing peptidase, partial [Proteobacteria bacterium]|nr:carboxy terminal-processing peptidase [Pseudomonadota bacterium]